MRPDTTSAIRAHLIETMQQRAASSEGEARRALEARLIQLRAPDADAPHAAPGANTLHSSLLRELIDQLTRDASSERAAYPDVPALADFRLLWSALRADSQLRQSVAHVPTDAGPLNSAALASRAIALMRELSPGYLQSFLGYVDDLAWLEQLGGAGAGIASGTAATRKRDRRKQKA